MRSFWRIFAALALMLPLGAFVAGTLVASAADDSDPRDTLIIRQNHSPTPSTEDEPEDDTPEVDVVTPSPDDVEDDDDGDDDGDDDNSGPGSSDDSSGPGSGDDGADDSGSGGGSSGHGSSGDDDGDDSSGPGWAPGPAPVRFWLRVRFRL